MSDLIPFDIQLEIIKRLPIKSLLRFRSVSKPWKSLINSKKFINDHASNHNHPHHLLVRYDDDDQSSETKYVSILDNDSFPQHKFHITLPESLKLPEGIRPNLLDSSHGLFCLYNFYGNDHLYSYFVRNQTVVVWNPSIRKSVDIVVPNVLKWPYKTVLGFGVCPCTLHFKLVKVSYINYLLHNISSIPYQVEVFTSSSGRGWRSPLCINNLPRKDIAFKSDQVLIDGFIYWLAYDRTPPIVRNMIMSFDMTREMFKEVSLPDCLTYFYHDMLDIFKLRESLVVLETDKDAEKQEHVVWIMEHDVPNSFTKLYTIKAPDASIGRVFGFMKSGEPIIRRSFKFGGRSRYETFAYDPSSKKFNDIVISENACLQSVSSYTETLLLLDR